MPTYQFKCQSCAAITEEVRRMADSAKKGPQCSCGAQTEKIISAPSMVMPDIQPYKAVAGDQRWITSRAQHREFLRSNDLTEVGNG